MTVVADVCYFDFEGSQLAYRIYGNGPERLLAFHGFGQDSQVFSALERTFDDTFTVYSLDLFFHGNSRYGASQLLTKTSWQRLIEAFLQELRVERFALMGFSLGGRFALLTAELFMSRVNQLILIAPDGITRNLWYRLATGSVPGRWVFAYVLRHLSMLSTIGHMLTRFGLLNRTAMRFAEISLGTPAQRELVYNSWTQFRQLRPDLETISKFAHRHAVRVRLYIGEFDRIVPGRYVFPLTQKLEHFELTVLKTGHNHLVEMAAEHLAQGLFDDLP
ncbi:alpha/beta hydrolase [Spirosoma soli]|uniref:Alpha/beta hydrolase n=1 Tax=Spirosoma soli TaxID=1770529 RepID=A0ABW5M9N2_9BACT